MAVAVRRTVGPISPWQRSPDLKDLIQLYELPPELRGQAVVPVGEFMEGALQEGALPSPARCDRQRRSC
jgi:hypothetical protein